MFFFFVKYIFLFHFFLILFFFCFVYCLLNTHPRIMSLQRNNSDRRTNGRTKRRMNGQSVTIRLAFGESRRQRIFVVFVRMKNPCLSHFHLIHHHHNHHHHRPTIITTDNKTSAKNNQHTDTHIERKEKKHTHKPDTKSYTQLLPTICCYCRRPLHSTLRLTHTHEIVNKTSPLKRRHARRLLSRHSALAAQTSAASSAGMFLFWRNTLRRRRRLLRLR